MITAGRTIELDAMRDRLEREYEEHTERLGRLMSRRVNRKVAVLNTAEITAHRRALADAARMLQRMAERNYGFCQHCAEEIAIERLMQRPTCRFCVDCETAISA